MSDQTIGLISSSVQLLLSLLLAIIATYGSFRIVDRLTRQIDEIEELKRNNIALSIMLAAILLSSAMIIREATFPAISTLQTFLYHGMTWTGALKLIALIAGYIVLSVLMAVGSTWFGASLFLKLTRNLDELAEIRKNNVAVAITLGAAIVIMGMFLASGIGGVLQALIPFPAVQPIEVLGS